MKTHKLINDDFCCDSFDCNDDDADDYDVVYFDVAAQLVFSPPQRDHLTFQCQFLVSSELEKETFKIFLWILRQITKINLLN